MASGGEGAAKVSSAKLTRSIFTVVLWIAAAALVLFGLAALGGALDSAGTDAAGRGLSQAFGVILLFIGGGACLALWLARWWRGWLIVAALIVGAPAAFFGWWATSLAISESRHRQRVEELHSGRYHFGDQPSLLTIAQAISINDVETIRTAAREVRDVQAPGRDGMTLLNFAVTQCWHKPQLVSAVAALLAAGADPNFTSGERDSYAMANSVHGPVALLRTMLDAGGNPNAVDAESRPIVFGVWQLGYFEGERRARLELLLERGADSNSALPRDESFQAGYTLLLYRVAMGRGDPTGYADALLLLERGADPNRAAKDGITLAQMMQEHRAFFTPEREAPPDEFEQLWQTLVERGVLVPAA